VLTVVLTRHGSTPRSDPEQHLGQGIDVGLSAEGEAAARALSVRLEGVAFDRIVSSPLRRAVQTVEILAAGRAVETDPRLAEMDYGEWEGLTYTQIEARDLERRRRWEDDPAAEHCPGGESGNEVAARVRSFLADAIDRAGSGAVSDAREPDAPEPAGRILVVAHATLNRILLCIALGVPVRDFRRRFRQDLANLTILRFPSGVAGGALLLLANDIAHLGMTPPGLR
jgi:broad specificity phosphatase PhoE